MSFVVRFFSFTKRENSTKVPSETTILSGWRADCLLIDDTSFMTPTFKIERNDSANIINFNYCYVPNFNRYYFITDLRQYHNFWYVSCACDVLATYKAQIGPSSHYILRAASEYDGTINDTLYPANTDVTTQKNLPTADPLAWSGGNCYVIGIVGYTDLVTHQFGALRYYVFKPAGLKMFLKYLMDNIATPGDNWAGIATTEYSEGVQKALINPIQYITSCVCMPFSYDDVVGGATGSVKFGYYSYTVPAGDDYKVKDVTDTNVCNTKETVYINLPGHPQAAARGAYLNCQPYTRYTLHFGPWGDIDIDPMILRGNSRLKIETLYDLVSGVGRLIVSGNVDTDNIIFNGSVKIGVDVNLSQVYKDALGYESTLTKTLFGAISAGASVGMSPSVQGIANGLSSITSGIQDMTRLNYPTVSGKGSSGCYLQFHDPDNLYLIARFNEIVDENLAELGRPLCQVKQINTLSGYILCSGADCQITGTQEEAVKVNQYMNTGFFYE